MPSISVLMPVYNGQPFLRDSIESVLKQTFTDFEFIIIDDGSIDNTVDIIQEYAAKDKRIRLVRNPRNMGLIETLTIGNRYCTGEYIARMDADDISLPDRFERQYVYMQSHPEIDVLGSNSAFIDENGTLLDHVLIEPSDPVRVWLQMFFRCSIHHTTVFARSEVYKRFNESGLENTYIHAEDYAFWLRVGFEYTYANLNIILCHTRNHSMQVSNQFRETQRTSQLLAARQAYQRLLGQEISLDVLRSFMFYSHYEFSDSRLNREAIRVMYSLARAFIRKYPLSSLQKRAVKDYIFGRIAAYAALYLKDRRVRFEGLKTRFALNPTKLILEKLASKRDELLNRGSPPEK
jgi:glycosyltransferase involved in cell wall biosynthesis